MTKQESTSRAETPEEEAGEMEVHTDPKLIAQGGQITSVFQIVSAVASGSLPRDSGLGMLMVLANLSEDQAEAVLGSAGLNPAVESPPEQLPEDVGTRGGES